MFWVSTVQCWVDAVSDVIVLERIQLPLIRCSIVRNFGQYEIFCLFPGIGDGDTEAAEIRLIAGCHGQTVDVGRGRDKSIDHRKGLLAGSATRTPDNCHRQVHGEQPAGEPIRKGASHPCQELGAFLAIRQGCHAFLDFTDSDDAEIEIGFALRIDPSYYPCCWPGFDQLGDDAGVEQEHARAVRAGGRCPSRGVL